MTSGRHYTETFCMLWQHLGVWCIYLRTRISEVRGRVRKLPNREIGFGFGFRSGGRSEAARDPELASPNPGKYFLLLLLLLLRRPALPPSCPLVVLRWLAGWLSRGWLAGCPALAGWVVPRLSRAGWLVVPCWPAVVPQWPR